MRKLILSLALFAIVVGASAQSNIIKTNPFGLAYGNFNVTYERVLNPSASFLVKGNYMYKLLGLDVSLAGLGVGYRYYITHAKKEIPNGFYVNPQVAFAFGSIKDNNDTSYSATNFGIGAELGYQWVWSSGFTLDLGIGPMYNFVSSDSSDSANGIAPALTLAIGYAF